MGAEGSKPADLQARAAKEFQRMKKEAALELKRKKEEEERLRREEEERLRREEEERVRKEEERIQRLLETLANYNPLQKATWSWQREEGVDAQLEPIYIHYSDETNVLLNMSEQASAKIVSIGQGNYADLHRMCVYRSDTPNQQKQIRKTIHNQRQRMDLSRFNSDVWNIEMQHSKKPLRPGMTEFEAQLAKFRPFEPWLSYYWQKKQKLQSEPLPSMAEMTQGILTEALKYHKGKQINTSDNKQYMDSDQYLENIQKTWEHIFRESGLSEVSDSRLDMLSGITGKLSQAICFIYSLDTFLPALLDHTLYHRDYSKVDTLGPFACLLSKILQCKNKMKDEHQIKQIIKKQKEDCVESMVAQGYFKVYRGMYQTEEQVAMYQTYADNYLDEGSLIEDKFVIYAQNYCSTSYERETALAMGEKRESPGSLVLFQIFVRKEDIRENKHFVKMDFNPCYTAYPEEKECLFQQGSRFKVRGIEPPEADTPYTTITLETNF